MIYPATDQYIDLAKNTLENGEVIVYPTDTLFGFGVDATNTKAIQRLNRLKGRVKPLSIVLESIDHMYDFAELDDVVKSEINKLFPGAYTVLLPSKKKQSFTSCPEWFSQYWCAHSRSLFPGSIS